MMTKQLLDEKEQLKSLISKNIDHYWENAVTYTVYRRPYKVPFFIVFTLFLISNILWMVL